MGKLTQKQVVLNHLQKEGTLTSWAAIQRYGITRLSEYIRQLRREGWNVISTDKQVETTRYGKTVISEYSLGEQK